MRTAVLINNFNNGRFIAACVDSVLEQSEAADEIIVYDDGSTDNSHEKLGKFEKRIRVIAGNRPRETRPWINQIAAIAKSYQESTADIVFLLDGDDLFTPEKISQFKSTFIDHAECQMVQAPMQLIDSDGNALAQNMCTVPDADRARLAWVRRHHDLDVFVPTSGLAFRREFLGEYFRTGPETTGPLWLDVRLGCHALLRDGIRTMPQTLGQRRLNPNSHYTAGSAAPGFRLKDTYHRTRYFNNLCRRNGINEISLWRNRRFYRHLVRAALPQRLLKFREKITYPHESRRDPSGS